MAAECFPAEQLLAHVEAPVAPEYLPASQLRHAAIDVAPACGEYVPGAHDEHVSDSALEYVPETQVAHVLAPALERVPASHVKHVLDPGLECFPASHTKQTSGDDAQRELEDVPAGQLVQTEAPAVSAYLPASQGRQVPNEVAPGVGE